MVRSNDHVHEVGKFDAPPPLVLAPCHLVGGDIEGGKQFTNATKGRNHLRRMSQKRQAGETKV
jgi:hypothetical protein